MESPELVLKEDCVTRWVVVQEDRIVRSVARPAISIAFRTSISHFGKFDLRAILGNLREFVLK